ncbi:glycosyltransferase family 4 protein [Georgenia sp. Z1344]|uniref:glycosyltransferase family 4 protein n=1 Tax=Georgenia sp. Z1344 TaxID=3416706 RepID=UPI003CEB0011
MRIGIAHPYDVAHPGGVDVHVRQLAAALRSRGHEVVTFAPGRRPRGTDEQVAGRSLPVRFNGSVANVAPHPAAARRARRWVRESGLDVLHVHEPTVPSASAFALRAARAEGIPVVATFHAAIDSVDRLGPLAALQRRHLRGIAARIAVSEEAARTQSRWLGAECEVVPNGLDVAAFRPGAGGNDDERRAVSHPHPHPHPRPAPDGGGAPSYGDAPVRGPRVLFLGRAGEPRKGFRVLAEAWPRILAAHPGATLVVAGPGGDRAVEALASRLDPGHGGDGTTGTTGTADTAGTAAAARVDVRGRVSEDEKVRLLRGADVFVAPHTGGESFGIVLLEAMAARAPVVATDLPAFTAILGAHPAPLGLLARRDDPADLADRVGEALSERTAALERAARAARAVERYDWSVVAARVEEVYRRVVGTPGETSPPRSSDGDPGPS